MAKILISGYYGFNNAGDDSVLYGIITSIHKKDPSIELGILSNNPDKTKNMFNVSAYNRWNLTEVFKRIKENDLLLMGGGSLLQDATSPRSVLYYLGIVMAAKLFKKPVVFYAQGIGPIDKTLSKKLIEYVVNKVDVITVRDHQSGEDLKQLGVNKAPITVTADPAVTIQPSSIDLFVGKKILTKHHLDPKKTLAISVRSWKKEDHYKHSLAEIADHYAEAGWQILFIPMQFPADLSPSKDIAGLMKHKATILTESIDFKEIISIIGNCKLVLGMRLHSIILAAVMNIPFVAVSYDPKIDRFVDRLDMFSAGHIRNIDKELAIKQINFILANEGEVKQRLTKNMETIIDLADQSSQLTIDQLNRKS